MATPLSVVNGRFVPASEAAVPVTDAGFVLGATVAEQLRSCGGQLFRLEQHLDRLFRSLQIVGLDPGSSREELQTLAEQLAERNGVLLDKDDDLGLCIFVTPGTYSAYQLVDQHPRRVCMHTYPLPFHFWHETYQTGQSLRITPGAQVPDVCFPTELKCRSRMHYFLADQKARQLEPGSRALLLDLDGKVCEASTASLAIYVRDQGMVCPPSEKTLPGISLAFLRELAASVDIAWSERELLPEQVAAADEVLLCSTSPCLLPVTRLDGQPIGSGRPGQVFQQLLDAWGRRVGVDLAAQARRFAQRTGWRSDGVHG